MRVLLSDAFCVTSRQAALELGRSGHDVGVLAPDARPLLPLPREVARVHPVSAFGTDPWGWSDAAVEAIHSHGYDVLLPSHDQVAVLARDPQRILAAGTGVAVPTFSAFLRLQDRVGAAATLTEIGLPQPEGVVVRSAEALRQVADPPMWVKPPVGPPDSVRFIERREQLLRLADEWEAQGLFADGAGVLVQQPARGQEVCVQAVFEHGRLVMLHTSHVHRATATGAPVARTGCAATPFREQVAMLGGHLGWHGGLTLTAVTRPDSVMWTAVVPRLTAPGNAARCGLDLFGALAEISAGRSPASAPARETGVATHQFATGLVDAARSGRGAVFGELTSALLRRGMYAGSSEELLAAGQEKLGKGALTRMAMRGLLAPGGLVRAARQAVELNCLTAQAWRAVRAGARPAEAEPAPPRPAYPVQPAPGA